MISEELAEAVGSRGARIETKERKIINTALRKAGFDGNGRFKSIGMALNKASMVIEANGYEWGQVTSADLFRHPNGSQSILLAKKTDDPFSPLEVTNTNLYFQWTELQPDTYEVLAYLG